MSSKNVLISGHWADIAADKVIRERGEKSLYVCESGITPSGTVHIGNFREIISVDLVVRALRDRGKNVRFIYSWDDYDVFRKVPSNMPRKEELEKYLRQPITLVPDFQGSYESYAAYNEKTLENVLSVVGIEPEYIYQSEYYRKSAYAEKIKTVLEHKEKIRNILNSRRTEPLPENWWPLSIFCASCMCDTTRVLSQPGDYIICYACDSCGNEEKIDLRESGISKLPWRIDWPMRWSVENVDFEPAGKDHHSEGGSFDTADPISREIFNHPPPVTFQYDFVRIKGGSGKISSSTGEIVSLPDVLRYYQPEVVRFLFAGTRPNSEFAVSFDLDVLKVYEDYDKLERAYFNKPDNPKKLKKWEKDARIYEFSQINLLPKTLPYQIQIRHLTTLLQIHSGDINAVVQHLDLSATQIPKFEIRAVCAWNWLNDFAPEDFKFSLRSTADGLAELPPLVIPAMHAFRELAEEHLGRLPEPQFSALMYDLMHAHNLESSDFFTAVYQVFIGKDKGPRLVSFIHVLGRKTVLNLLSHY